MLSASRGTSVPQMAVALVKTGRDQTANVYARAIVLACGMMILFCVAGAAAQSKPQPAKVSDAAIQKSIEQALLDTSETLARALHVTVNGGVVTISGRVSSDMVRATSYPPAVLKQNVGAIVRALPGVKDVKLAFDADPPQPLSNENGSGRGGRGRI